MKPQTKPTDKQLQQMNDELVRLISTFGAGQITNLLSVGPSTIRQWLHRGRISATKAHEVCKHNAVRELGFTRESLRPDVECWMIGGADE